MFKNMAKTQYNLRLDQDLLQRLKDRAQSEGTSVTDILTRGAEKELKKKKK